MLLLRRITLVMRAGHSSAANTAVSLEPRHVGMWSRSGSRNSVAAAKQFTHSIPSQCCISDKLFVCVGTVKFGCIEERDAFFMGCTNHSNALILVGGRSVVAAGIHAAESHF